MPGYYDRSIPDELKVLLGPKGALAWLPDFLRKREGALALSDLQLRRDRKGRIGGALQVYVGSSSILEIAPSGRRPRSSPRVHFKLKVNAKSYRDVWETMPVKRVDLKTLT